MDDFHDVLMILDQRFPGNFTCQPGQHGQARGLLRMNQLVVAKRTGKQVIYSLAENFKTSGGKLKISLPSSTVTVEAGSRQISPGNQKARVSPSGGSLFDLS